MVHSSGSAGASGDAKAGGAVRDLFRGSASQSAAISAAQSAAQSVNQSVAQSADPVALAAELQSRLEAVLRGFSEARFSQLARADSPLQIGLRACAACLLFCFRCSVAAAAAAAAGAAAAAAAAPSARITFPVLRLHFCA